MKIPLQDKIAELERRIVNLEKGRRTNAVSTQTVQRVNLEPEMGRMWTSVDALFSKVFKP